MEGRLLLSTVSDAGTSTLTLQLGSNEGLSVQSAGSTYTFTLNNGNDFTNGGVVSAGSDFSGFGTGSLVLESSGVARYSTINIVDTTSGASVDLLDSGTNAYSSNIDITLDQGTASQTVQIHTSAFTGSAGLNVSTTGSIAVLGGLKTDSGAITLDAGTAGTLTSGIADEIAAPILSNSGAITLNGTGGLSTSQESDGVRLINGGLIDSGSGPVNITGTVGDGSGSGVDVEDTVSDVQQGVISATGNINITGYGNSASPGSIGVNLYTDTSLQSTGTGAIADLIGTGANAATITVNGTSSAGIGVQLAFNPYTSLTSVDGDISITGSSSSSSSSASGVAILQGTRIASTGTDANAATITIKGTDTGGGIGVDIYNNLGVTVSGPQISSAATLANTGDITIMGTSVNSEGVHLLGPSVGITSVDGDISITGGTSGSNNANAGVFAINGVSISTTGTDANAGSITMNGTDTGAGYGVYIDAGLNGGVTISTVGVGAGAGGISITGASGSMGEIGIEVQGLVGVDNALSSVDGDISLTGTTASSVRAADGLALAGGTIASTGAGTITLDGTNTGAGTGVLVNQSGAGVTTATGAISISGSSKQTTGVSIRGSVTIQSTSGGTVTVSTPYVSTNNDSIVFSNTPVIESTSTVTIQSGGGVTLISTATLSGTAGVAILGDYGDTGSGTGVVLSIAGMLEGGPVTVTGGAGGDTITFDPASSPSATILSGTGADAITVTPTNVTGTVAVQASTPNTGSPTLTIDGTSAAEVFDVSGTQTTFGASTVTYVNIPTVSVAGVGGADTFSVTPSQSVTLNLIGEPNTPYLDTFSIQTPAGQTSNTVNTTASSGYVTTTGGYQNVNFTNFSTTNPSLSVVRGGYIYSRATQKFSQTLTITNTGNQTITGPISLVLDGLTNATLTNATGTTSSANPPAGSPYINLSVSSLAPGASTTVVLFFSDPTSGSISYNTRFIVGTGPR